MVTVCIYGYKGYLSVSVMHRDLHVHPGFKDHLLAPLQGTLAGLAGFRPRQVSVQCLRCLLFLKNVLVFSIKATQYQKLEFSMFFSVCLNSYNFTHHL